MYLASKVSDEVIVVVAYDVAGQHLGASASATVVTSRQLEDFASSESSTLDRTQ